MIQQLDFFQPATPAIPAEVLALIERGALFVINHSGGKDSQAMTAVLRAIVPASQLVVVYADLGRVVWKGAKDHIRATTAGLPFIVCRNESRDLLQMVADRGMFPSPQQRQCTSDHKRGPIEKAVRHYLKANPQFGGLVVNCMGLRADESPMRAKAVAFKQNAGNSVAGREWYDWLPIHDMKLSEVWKTIADAGQEPHPVYKTGMSRMSCIFCIMSTDRDLTIAARENPKLYREYVNLEKSTGRTMMMPRGGVAKTLEEITGIVAG